MPKARLKRVGPSLVLGILSAWAQISWAAPVDLSHAEAVARKWLVANPQPLDAQLSNQVREVKTYVGADGAAAYYIAALEPEGFLVLTADDLVQPVICFSATGTYDSDEHNCLAALVKGDAGARVAQARVWQKQAAGGMPLPAIAAAAAADWGRLLDAGDVGALGLTSVSDVRVSPFTQSKWNQSTECGTNCYNYYTPNNYVCGCVATAMAQTMRFHQFPTAGIGVHSFSIDVCGSGTTQSTRGGDGAGGPYDWLNMVLDPGCSTNDTQRQAIGALCHDAGVSVSMDYCSDGSGTDTLAAGTALKSTFGYSNAVKGGTGVSNIGTGLNGMVNPNLDAGYPAILGITGTPGGHAIVADGYGYETSVLYHHLNMGWGGSDNAWYNLPDINSSPAFTSVYKCIYNIYVDGTGEIISGRVTVGGIPISGAVITATRSGGGTYTATTGSRGIYALVKVPSNSSYVLTTVAAGYTFTDRNASTTKSNNYSLTSGNAWGTDIAGEVFDPCPLLFGDSDFDHDVDQEDFGAFQACLSGTEMQPLSEVCTCFDRNDDSLINSVDFTAFKNCMTGAGTPSSPPSPPAGCDR
jgi:hypothetical protein